MLLRWLSFLAASIPSSPDLSDSQDSHPPSHEARLGNRLSLILSAVACSVDVIGFLNLKVFTAHITGNLVLMAAQMAHAGPPNIDQIISVPVFAVAVAGIWLIARASALRGSSLLRLLLLVHFLMLVCVWIFSVLNHPAANPSGLAADIAAMIAVSAMACQFTLSQLGVPGAPSTAVMTGNLTKTVLALLDALSPSKPMRHAARERLTKNLKLVASFFIGCLAGAAASSWIGDWAWLLPAAMAVVPLASSRGLG
jgi:uncharacterized membrane protein YoaK (UPF0700 family)